MMSVEEEEEQDEWEPGPCEIDESGSGCPPWIDPRRVRDVEPDYSDFPN